MWLTLWRRVYPAIRFTMWLTLWRRVYPAIRFTMWRGELAATSHAALLPGAWVKPWKSPTFLIQRGLPSGNRRLAQNANLRQPAGLPLHAVRESECAIVVPTRRDRIDVWWTLATESGEPSSRTDKQISLDGADNLIDALRLLVA
jgi:hypothetical protein